MNEQEKNIESKLEQAVKTEATAAEVEKKPAPRKRFAGMSKTARPASDKQSAARPKATNKANDKKFEPQNIEPMDPKDQVDLSELRAVPIHGLVAMVEASGIEKSANKAYKRHDLIMLLLKDAVKNGKQVIGGGVLEVRNDGSAFARSGDASYLNCRTDVFVPQVFIKRFQLKTGDTLQGILRPPKEGERYFTMASLQEVNFDAPEKSLKRIDFDDLTAIFPSDAMTLESGSGTSQDITARIIDLVAPIGFGQRAMVVSPPKAGKTMMLQNIAHAITSNHPNCKLMVLLIDERPEEVTDMTRSVRGEVIASTFDEAPSRHVQVAEMVIAKAKRLVEYNHDVVILLDSMTRLARAYNSVTPSSGKVLTGGVEANALQKPKRFFGSARNIEGGGSLTIISTALVETGSKMEEVIYEEFKGTGNMEVHLSRFIAQKRIWPAISIPLSGTRRDDLFLEPDYLNRVDILRRHLQSLEDVKSIEFLIDKLRNSKTNKDFFDAMRGN